jgi:outer membrane protein
MLNNEDLLVQLKTQSALTNRQVERLMILDSSGAISPLLLSDMRGQYASDQLLILNAENAAENSRISLFRLMNIPYQKNAEFEKLKVADLLTKYPVTSQQVYDEALNKFPQVKADELRKKSAQKSIDIAKGQLLPVLSLSGAISTNYSNAARNEIFLNTTEISTTDYVTVSGNKLPVIRQQNNYSSQKIAYGSQLNNNLATSLNLNLRIPIFNSFQTKNRIKLTTINLKETELAVINTKTSLQQFIEEAYANMNNALERYKVLLKQYEAYKESFRIAEVRFNSGLGTVIDYLTAKTNLERTAANLIIEKYNYLLRTKVLDYYRGNPLN